MVVVMISLLTQGFISFFDGFNRPFYTVCGRVVFGGILSTSARRFVWKTFGSWPACSYLGFQSPAEYAYDLKLELVQAGHGNDQTGLVIMNKDKRGGQSGEWMETRSVASRLLSVCSFVSKRVLVRAVVDGGGYRSR